MVMALWDWTLTSRLVLAFSLRDGPLALLVLSVCFVGAFSLSFPWCRPVGTNVLGLSTSDSTMVGWCFVGLSRVWSRCSFPVLLFPHNCPLCDAYVAGDVTCGRSCHTILVLLFLYGSFGWAEFPSFVGPLVGRSFLPLLWLARVSFH